MRVLGHCTQDDLDGDERHSGCSVIRVQGSVLDDLKYIHTPRDGRCRYLYCDMIQLLALYTTDVLISFLTASGVLAW